MRRHTASLEEELSVKAETLKSLHEEMAQGKKKMASTELSLQGAHNELSVARARISQESERVTTIVLLAAALRLCSGHHSLVFLSFVKSIVSPLKREYFPLCYFHKLSSIYYFFVKTSPLSHKRL